MHLSYLASFIGWGPPLNWKTECLVCGTILLLIMSVMPLVVRSYSASVRHGIWVTGFIVLLALPFALMVMPRLHVLRRWHAKPAEAHWNNLPTDTVWPTGFADPSDTDWRPWNAAGGDAEMPVEPLPLTPPTPDIQPKPESQGDRLSMPLDMAASGIWLTGSIVFAGRLFASLVWLHSVKRLSMSSESSKLVDEIAFCAERLGIRGARLVLMQRDIVPMAWGIVHKRIMIPVSVAALDAPDRRAIIMHELGHIARRDPLWQLISELSGILFWFHPLYWYARHQSAAMRERACDDLVLGVGLEPANYARCLLDFVSTPTKFVRHRGIGVAMSSSSRIESRIRAMMSPTVDRSPLTNRTIALLVVAAIGVLFPLCVLRADHGSSNALMVPENPAFSTDRSRTSQETDKTRPESQPREAAREDDADASESPPTLTAAGRVLTP